MKFDSRHVPDGGIVFPSNLLPSFDEFYQDHRNEYAALQDSASVSIRDKTEPCAISNLDEEQRQESMREMRAIPACYRFMRKMLPNWMFAQRYPEMSHFKETTE